MSANWSNYSCCTALISKISSSREYHVRTGLLTPTVEVNEANEMVVVTRRTLNRGDIIRDADVELQPIDPKAQRLQIATERRAVVGMEVLSPIREGQLINLSQLRKPRLVKRGELMRVRPRAAGVQITTTARATGWIKTAPY
ncbi:MAG: flagellar basal body P-ring formation protein FlgA [Planctomycetia bacterium]|nr:flagellar basal body P-ring formation protein FlgA [Planctomycetia bacterium]